jgi:hypothetical protein
MANTTAILLLVVLLSPVARTAVAASVGDEGPPSGHNDALAPVSSSSSSQSTLGDSSLSSSQTRNADPEIWRHCQQQNEHDRMLAQGLAAARQAGRSDAQAAGDWTEYDRLLEQFRRSYRTEPPQTCIGKAPYTFTRGPPYTFIEDAFVRAGYREDTLATSSLLLLPFHPAVPRRLLLTPKTPTPPLLGQ